MLGNKIKPIKSGMIGERVTFDPTESLNNAMGPVQAQGPRLFNPTVGINQGIASGQTQGPMVGLGGPQPMGQPQGPRLFDPRVGINQANAARQAGMMGAMGSIASGLGMGNAQPMSLRSMIGRGGRGRGRQPSMTPRQVRPNRTIGRGAGAFGMGGRGLVKPMPKARGRGRGRRR